jgi:hypothetical protein
MKDEEATMSKMFSQTFNQDQASVTASEYQPLDGGDPVDPKNPAASEYQPLDGGDPVDPKNPAASEYQPLDGEPIDPGDPAA